jgi:hypothetical protein
MPNWSFNTLTVICNDTKKLKEFKKKAYLKEGDRENHFSMNNLYPMPKELEETISGSNAIVPDDEYEKYYNKQLAQKAKNPTWFSGFSISESMANEFREKYGATNWYDWKVGHWETKWDTADSTIESETNNTIVYYFETAWSPPMRFLQKISRDYPDFTFSIHYNIEGNNIMATVDYHNGIIVREEEASELECMIYDFNKWCSYDDYEYVINCFQGIENNEGYDFLVEKVPEAYEYAKENNDEDLLSELNSNGFSKYDRKRKVEEIINDMNEEENNDDEFLKSFD